MVLPRIFGYTLIPAKQTLKDGTVITSVRFAAAVNVKHV